MQNNQALIDNLDRILSIHVDMLRSENEIEAGFLNKAIDGMHYTITMGWIVVGVVAGTFVGIGALYSQVLQLFAVLQWT